MHWELTPIVVLGFLAFGLYQAAKDVKNTRNQPISGPDLIQDNINAGAADMVIEGAVDKALPTVVPTIAHVAEAIVHHVHF